MTRKVAPNSHQRRNGSAKLTPYRRDVMACDQRPILITGGAGFIGTNLAQRLLRGRRRVIVYDNLSRPGVERNARWLEQTFGNAVQLEVADVADADRLAHLIRHGSGSRTHPGVSHVFHFAAQVAVTTSLDDPRADFHTNVGGTLNVLEAIRHATPRRMAERPPLLFTSTNKVYGDLHGLPLEEAADRHQPIDADVRQHGVAEGWLDFHSPYGCSKGAADQYVLDYARSFHLQNVVFRMSCIYGPHQCGSEDQGWVAHFLMQAMRNQPIVLFGDGRQVRDLLYVADLVDAMLIAMQRIDATAGHAFNIGGGPANALSLQQCLRRIAQLVGRPTRIDHGPWRSGDQKYYVSDTRRFHRATGWSPRTTAHEGIARLHQWLQRQLITPARAAAGAAA